MKTNIQNAKIVQGDMYQDCVLIKNSTTSQLNDLMMNDDVMGAVELIEQQNKIMGTYHRYYPD